MKLKGPQKVGDFLGKRSHSDANVDFQEKKSGSILKVGVHVACGDAVPEGAPRNNVLIVITLRHFLLKLRFL